MHGALTEGAQRSSEACSVCSAARRARARAGNRRAGARATAGCVGLDPGDLGDLHGARRAFDDLASVDEHDEVEGVVGVEDDLVDAAHAHAAAELLAHLARERDHRILAGLDLSARELPQQRHGLIGAAARDEHARAVAHERRDDELARARRGGHGRSARQARGHGRRTRSSAGAIAPSRALRSMSARRSSTRNGFWMTAQTDSSRKRLASGENAPPVTNTKRSASAGQRSRTASCRPMPDSSGIWRSHRTTSYLASRSSARSASTPPSAVSTTWTSESMRR